MFDFLDVPAHGAYDLVSLIAAGTGTAAAIVLFTVAVRVMLHPLARSAMRGEKARAALAPQAAKLREKHKKDPERMQREMMVLYQDNGVSMFAGCLPMLLQIPVFMVLYRLFTAGSFDGTPNNLLSQVLFGAPLGSHFFSSGSVVFIGLFVALLVVGYFAARAMLAETPKFLRLLPFGTSFAVAVVPLAAGCTCSPRRRGQ
ncbi:YidC/Oxa1 family membrane protein insertase [Kibdelosporangium philippinense]|uniref:YidC/Oxa1 family membrane protein insertase n=1 Tax=Kibdelosporangium philippinense TaxID=211113 RepID=UPI00361E4CE0